MNISATASVTPTRPGKLAQAVGQIAKAAVAEARAAGVDLPKNAQGFAASSIAHGAEASSVFAAMIIAEPVTEAGEADTGAGDVDQSEEAPEMTDDTLANVGYGSAAAIVGDSVQDGAETALALLEAIV